MSLNSNIPDYILEEYEALKNPIIEWDNSFEIPNYVFQEIDEYYRLGKPLYKWNNVVALMNLARMNNSLTKEQMKILIEKYK